ncbi:unnamed protein product [Rotaria sp. Silwood1]|nr:unnamed protein product [Rotaria sp. Silwood1]
MHSIRLFQKGLRTTESRKKYTVDSEWHSNTQLRQTIEFIIYTSNMSICENLKDSIISRCHLSNFEVHYLLHGQQTAARKLEITTEDVTRTLMYNQIQSQFSSNHQGTVALTSNDYKNLLSETMDQITMNLQVEEGFGGIQDPVTVDRLLDRQLQYKQVKLERINDHLWESLYWTPELTRPDRLSKVLNKVIKKDDTDSNKFRYDYTQTDEALKQNLKFYDRQKLDELEKHLAALSQNGTHTTDVDGHHKATMNFYVLDGLAKENTGVNIVFRVYNQARLDDRQQWDPNGYHFDLFFHADFLHGRMGDTLHDVANLVAYLNFPKEYHLYGTLVITLTGGYSYELTTGILRKRFHIIYNAQSGLLRQLTEITDSSGSLPSQWKIGDLDSTTHRIPIYHLVSSGNVLTVRVEATTIHERYPNDKIILSDPIISTQ